MLYVQSIPVMNLIPNISYDYRLIILTAPLAIVLFDSVLTFAFEGAWRAAITIVGLMLLMGGMSRSCMITTTGWLANKYPYVLLMQVLFAIAALAPRGWRVERTHKTPMPRLLLSAGGRSG
jgi:hypothetical protein